MRRNVWMVATVACLATAGASAQSGSTQADPMKDKGAITVTGCLQPDTVAASSAGASFKLTNVMKAEPPAAATGTAGTTGTSGSMPSSATIASSYVLEGSDVELKGHVGHKVEVTGTPSAMASMHPTTTGDPAPPPATSATAHADAAPHLKVSSVRMLASDCAQK